MRAQHEITVRVVSPEEADHGVLSSGSATSYSVSPGSRTAS